MRYQELAVRVAHLITGQVAEAEDAAQEAFVNAYYALPSEPYIPVGAITRVEHDRVYLNVTKEQAKAEDWGTAPREAATGGRAPAAQAQPRTTGQAGERIELSEEELRARTETAKAGEVGVRKDVVTSSGRWTFRSRVRRSTSSVGPSSVVPRIGL